MHDSVHVPRCGQARRTLLSGVDMEVLIGYLLLAGVLASSALLLIGLAWHWAATGRLGDEYAVAGMNVFQFVVADARQALAGDMRPRLLVSLGIAVLILTPYVRVLASMLYFAFVTRNWKYTLFTAVLTYSLFLR
jgi:uncharacterized membrane protein